MTHADTLTSAVKALIQAAPHTEQIILFGSQARGDATEDSDWDFLVIEPVVENRAHEMVRLRRALRPLRLAVDVLVYSRAEIKQWSHQPGTALQDMTACKLLSPSVEISDAIIGFHAQQAVEKAIKSALSHHGVEFRRTHDLISLLDLLEDNGLPPPPHADWLDELNPYAVEARYGTIEPDGLNRSHVLSC